MNGQQKVDEKLKHQNRDVDFNLHLIEEEDHGGIDQFILSLKTTDQNTLDDEFFLDHSKILKKKYEEFTR